MALRARLNDAKDAVLEIVDAGPIPAHKVALGQLVPVEDVKPAFDGRLEALAGPVLQIQSGKVLRVWTKVRRSLEEQKQMVKGEAQRRIVLLTGKNNLQDCIIKELNALMRAAKITDKRMNGEAVTVEEEVEADALRVFNVKIEAIRVASNNLEVTDPIPLDYADDKYWPIS